MTDAVERLKQIAAHDPVTFVSATEIKAVVDELTALRSDIARMREALGAAIPALERVHAMTPGGPKKSDALAVLNRARSALSPRGES